MNTSIMVVKLGGTDGVNFRAICSDVKNQINEGHSLVLIHGGSADANALGGALNYPPKFIQSPSGFTSRYTDLRTLEIFAMAVNGRVNTTLVAMLQGMDVNALGLCGVDGGLMIADRKEAVQSLENGKRKIIRDDYSGKISRINIELLHTLLAGGYIPVIAPLALSPSGEILNVDADRAAARVAAALHSAVLVLLTAVPGFLSAYPDESSLVHHLSRSQLTQAINIAEGRMKKKMLGAQEALDGGVERVYIADGRAEDPIRAALAGAGTLIT